MAPVTPPRLNCLDWEAIAAASDPCAPLNTRLVVTSSGRDVLVTGRSVPKSVSAAAADPGMKRRWSAHDAYPWGCGRLPRPDRSRAGLHNDLLPLLAGPERNKLCPCGSGRKVKHCCRERATKKQFNQGKFNG